MRRLLLLAALAVASCSFFHDDYPDVDCDDDDDCFSVAGEFCNPATSQCEPEPPDMMNMDAAVDMATEDSSPDATADATMDASDASDATDATDGGT